MKKKKYLPLYFKWMESGRLPKDGLCISLMDGHFDDKLLTALLSPDNPDHHSCAAYWGFDGDDRSKKYKTSTLEEVVYAFTPLRQNIVLFLSAINGEL